MPRNYQRKTEGGNYRTMSWLNIPKGVQQFNSANLLLCEVDYLEYNFYDVEGVFNAIKHFGFTGEIDMDNSNIEYNADYSMALKHVPAPMGSAYEIFALLPGFPMIPLYYVVFYSQERKGIIPCMGKAVVYGAYSRFEDLLREQIPEARYFANFLEMSTIISGSEKGDMPATKRVRVDVALDIATPIFQEWHRGWIVPSKVTKKIVKTHNPLENLGGYQSFSYNKTAKNSIGIRIYNKVLDIIAKNKQSWYPDYGSEQFPHVQRIELVFGEPYASQPIGQLVQMTRYKFLSNEVQPNNLHYKNRPRSKYSAISAYEYMKKYSKNHGKDIAEVLCDLSEKWYLELQEKNINPDDSDDKRIALLYFHMDKLLSH